MENRLANGLVIYLIVPKIKPGLILKPWLDLERLVYLWGL